MENVVSNFESPEISIKLTDEKLYIITPTTSETFALRSVNGIGIVDLVDKYNQELTVQKNAKSPILIYIFGGLFLIGGLMNLSKGIGAGIIGIILGGGLIYWGTSQKPNDPTLKTAVRLMISGMNRDFEFDKSGAYSSQIAELVVKIEETLTAYHKNQQ